MQQRGHVLQLDQRKYIAELLEEFDVPPYPVTTPMRPKQPEPTTAPPPLPEDDARVVRRMIGCLVCLAVMTRPDISHAVSVASRRLHAPTMECKSMAIRIYQYLRGAADHALTYSQPSPDILIHSDSSFDTFPQTHRSQTGVAVLMFGGAVAWMSARQHVVAPSSSEGEHVAQCSAAQLGLSALQFVEDARTPGLTPPPHLTIYADNQAAIKMAHEGADTTHTKHIERRLYFLRELVARGRLKFSYVPSALNYADGLTKPLARCLHRQSLRRLLGLMW